MIFASVGSMLPFDRLVEAVDLWAGDNPATPVLVQTGGGAYAPRFARSARLMPMAEYRAALRECDLFVAHVGMGSILQALELGKPMLLMPRRAALGEHTSDHQAHTARVFADREGITIVDEADDLRAALSRFEARPAAARGPVASAASPDLINGVAAFLRAARPALRG